MCLKDIIMLENLPANSNHKIFVFYKMMKIFELNLMSHNCIIGQTFVQKTVSKLLGCEDCLPLWHSFERNVQNLNIYCEKCTILNPFHCYGGFKLKRKPNFWRLNKFSIKFIKCNNENICLGEKIKSDEFEEDYPSKTFCVFPYQGALCQECFEGYGLDTDKYCLKCSKRYIGKAIKMTLAIIFRIVLILFSLKNSLEKSYLITKKNIDPTKVLSQNLIKIFTDHMIILQVLSNFPVKIKNFSLMILSEFSVFSPLMSQSFSFECFILSFNFNKSIIYFRFLTSVSFSIILLAAGIIFFRNKKFVLIENSGTIKKSSIQLSNLWIFKNIFYFVSLLIIPDIYLRSLELFACVNIGDKVIKEQRNPVDLKVRCYRKENNLWKLFGSIPVISIFIILAPLIAIINIFILKRANKLQNQKNKFIYGFLFYSYKDNLFFLEFFNFD